VFKQQKRKKYSVKHTWAVYRTRKWTNLRLICISTKLKCFQLQQASSTWPPDQRSVLDPLGLSRHFRYRLAFCARNEPSTLYTRKITPMLAFCTLHAGFIEIWQLKAWLAATHTHTYKTLQISEVKQKTNESYWKLGNANKTRCRRSGTWHYWPAVQPWSYN